MDTFAKQKKRILTVLGGSFDANFDAARSKWIEHLSTSLNFPVEVKGIEDFRWEEFYIFGPGSKQKYDMLKKTQPSYTDHYDLLSISLEAQSFWMMSPDDIAAHVRRISDGREFTLGLSELEATSKGTSEHQVLRDYSVWYVNR
jgi:hypothetical protein